MSSTPSTASSSASEPKKSLARIWLEGWGQQSFWFGVYVLWLTSFPMSGTLLGPEVHITWFALPHALVLLAFGRWLTPHALHRLLPMAAIGTAMVTMLYAFEAHGSWTSGAAVLLIVLGLIAAPLSVQFGVLLGSARWPVAAAAVGLCVGNLGSMLLELAPGSAAGKLAALACLIPGALWPRVHRPLVRVNDAHLVGEESPIALWRLLPFLALFQTVSGLMYSSLWPSYRAEVIWPGTELLVYVVTVLVAVRYVPRNGLACVLSAVALAVASFAVHHAADGPVGHHLSLFLMLSAAGIVDLVLLSEVLARARRIRAYGYAVGLTVLGIALGETLVFGLKGSDLSVALFALALLNLATVALILQRNAPPRHPAAPEARGALEPELHAAGSEEMPPAPTKPPAPAPLPTRITDQLSAQEQRVLQAVLENQPYRDIAQTFGISESSVKTYMQRIYRKLGIYRRGQLANLMADARDSASSTAVSETQQL